MNKKKKTTKRNLVSSIISLILCVSMFVGTTFAWFTDSVSSGVNKIQAGNLDIELYHSSSGEPSKSDGDKVTATTQLFQMTLWEPGAVVYENFLIANEGTLALKYDLDFNLANMTKNYVVEKSGDILTGTARSLVDVLYVKVDNGIVSGARPSYTPADGILLKDFLADTSRSIFAGALEAGGSKIISVVVYWPQGENDNLYNLKNGWYSSEIENKTTDDTKNALYVELPIALNACQYTSESDSFDNQYDKEPGTEPPFVKPVSQTSAPVSNGSSTELNTDKGSVVIPEDSGLPEDTVAHLEVYDVDVANSNLTVTDDETVVSYQVELLDQNGNKIDLSGVAEKTLLARVEVGYGLDVNKIKVYRDGTTLLNVVKYEDGYVYFESDHFCDVDVVLQETVARIGNIYYYSYQAAAEDVATGAVIDCVVDVNAMEEAIVAKFGATKFVIDKGENQVTVKGAAAVIGTTTYESVADAVSAAQAGDTIVLVDDVVSNGLSIQKNLTIELNGKILNINAKDGFLVKNAKLILQDTSVGQTGTINHNGAWDLADVSSSGTLAITSGTYTTNGRYGILYVGSGNSEITGGRFSQDVTCANGYEVVEVDGWYIPTQVYYWIDEAAETYATPVDTENKVVTIVSAEELALFAKEVNNGNTYAGYTVKLANDIDLAGKRWTSIGNHTDSKPFKGTFDGQNYTISNMEIPKKVTKKGVGLFGKVFTAKIKNLIVTGTVNSDTTYVGGVVGHGYATIENVTFIGNISGSSVQTGGIAGSGGFTLNNCKVIGNIHGDTWVGGLVGNCQDGGAYSYCSVEGVISANYAYYGVGAAGLVAIPLYSTQVIEYCYSDTVVKIDGEEVNVPVIGAYNCTFTADTPTFISTNSWNLEKNPNTSYEIGEANVPYVTCQTINRNADLQPSP